MNGGRNANTKIWRPACLPLGSLWEKLGGHQWLQVASAGQIVSAGTLLENIRMVVERGAESSLDTRRRLCWPMGSRAELPDPRNEGRACGSYGSPGWRCARLCEGCARKEGSDGRRSGIRAREPLRSHPLPSRTHRKSNATGVWNAWERR